MARIQGENKILNGVLSFSCATSPEGHYFNIQLDCTDSHLRIMTLEMSHEAFGRMLAHGQGERNCKVDLIVNPNHGKIHEHKNEAVPVKYSEYKTETRKKELIEAVKPFEESGWIADIYPNSRTYNNGKQQVVFRRYV